MSCVTRLKELFRKIDYEFYLFAFLMLDLVARCPLEVNPWMTPNYILNFDQGFSTRLLVGSVVKFFFPDFVTGRQLFQFVFVALTLLNLLAAVLCGRVLRMYRNETRGVIYVLMAYLASPAALTYLVTQENMGRLEIYLLILTLVQIVVLLRVKNVFVKYALVLLLSGACCMIHQIYIFMFFPLVFVCGVYNVFEAKNKKKELIVGGLVFVLIGAFFLYLQLFSSINLNSISAVKAYIETRTDYAYLDDNIYYEYFAQLKEHWTNFWIRDLTYNLRHTVVTLIFLLPLFGFIVSIWKKAYRCCKEKRIKWMFTLMQLSNLAMLPVWLIMVDWERYIAVHIILEFGMILILLYKRNSYMITAVKQTAAGVEKHMFLYLLFLLFLFTLDKLDARCYQPYIVDYLANIVKMFLPG